MKNIPEENGFHQTLKSFVQNAEVDVTWLLEEEKRIIALVKSTTYYFHGNAGKDECIRLFFIVRDFLIILDEVCKEVKNLPIKPNRTPRKEESTVAPTDPCQNPPIDPRQLLFLAIMDRWIDSSSSDDESEQVVRSLPKRPIQ
ncbi:formin 5 [Olea europaea subsp. europaea]|uniref:Formin 5 n=1 Tax=Olea europaea subsp. europaea TaxID=158383 RepID=A0A8S0Q9D0_OLEEU|nr:formin 5 [Olea europaea subsp. europaea]